MTYAGKDGIEIACEPVCLEPDRPDMATITAKVNGEAVGWATTEIAGRRDARGRPKGFSVMDVWVKEGECHKGIARAMYDHAYLSGFGPLYPQSHQSPAGVGFWYTQFRKWFPVGGQRDPVMEWRRIRGFSLSPDLKRLAAHRIDAGWAQEKVEKQRADTPEEDEEIKDNAPVTDLAAYVLTPELRGADRAIVPGFKRTGIGCERSSGGHLSFPRCSVFPSHPSHDALYFPRSFSQCFVRTAFFKPPFLFRDVERPKCTTDRTNGREQPDLPLKNDVSFSRFYRASRE